MAGSCSDGVGELAVPEFRFSDGKVSGSRLRKLMGVSTGRLGDNDSFVGKALTNFPHGSGEVTVGRNE